MNYLISKEDKIIKLILSNSNTKKYQPKTIFINQGEKAKKLFYLIKGSVVIFLKNNYGKEIILSYLHQGDFIGEINLFKKNKIRTAYVKTKYFCLIAEISYEKIQKLINTNLNILVELYIQGMKRLKTSSLKTENLAFLNVKDRIKQTLINLAKQPDAITHPDGMQIKITRQEIGQIVGCSRETAGRVLRILENKNFIFAHGKTIVIFGTR